jgi:hypothetical protein|tara:strand:+ start:717 stop:935 length:219 start_codon:yes stop_codon:yes gene_type:complete
MDQRATLSELHPQFIDILLFLRVEIVFFIIVVGVVVINTTDLVFSDGERILGLLCVHPNLALLAGSLGVLIR